MELDEMAKADEIGVISAGCSYSAASSVLGTVQGSTALPR
jgi:hypothetical protein